MVSVVNDINAGIHTLSADLCVIPDAEAPLGGIAAEVVVGHTRLRLKSVQRCGGGGMSKTKAQHLAAMRLLIVHHDLSLASPHCD
jgi:hypothetical protein